MVELSMRLQDALGSLVNLASILIIAILCTLHRNVGCIASRGGSESLVGVATVAKVGVITDPILTRASSSIRLLPLVICQVMISGRVDAEAVGVARVSIL